MMKRNLVMLHGFGCDSRVFSSIGAKLSRDYEVMMVDIPGHGQTKEQFSDFGFSAYTILHALDHYLKAPYSLLGWSMGGQIALEMFKQLKKRCINKKCEHDHSPIESLILISSTPRFVECDDFPIGMNKAVFSKFKKGIKDDPSKTMAGFYEMLFSKDEDASNIPYLRSLSPDPKTLTACLESFERFDHRDVLPAINVPTLIIAGDSDQVIDPKASVYMSQEIKNSELRVYNKAGHAPFLTREKEVIGELSTFLG